MRTLHTLLLPMLMVLLLASCASTQNTTAVRDDVYFMPGDEPVTAARPKPVPSPEDEARMQPVQPGEQGTDDYYDPEVANEEARRGYYDMAYNDPFFYNYGRFGFGTQLGWTNGWNGPGRHGLASSGQRHVDGMEQRLGVERPLDAAGHGLGRIHVQPVGRYGNGHGNGSRHGMEQSLGMEQPDGYGMEPALGHGPLGQWPLRRPVRWVLVLLLAHRHRWWQPDGGAPPERSCGRPPRHLGQPAPCGLARSRRSSPQQPTNTRIP
ncbi:MAG: hypothetical protein MUE88_02830 [Flavobacteriales bacterium]|nr:hypothetical protein [Flavobacteriales bacterium]